MKIDTGNRDLKFNARNNILDKMSEERIFDVCLSDDKKQVEFVEGCDNYFGVWLDREELFDLAIVLLKMGNGMKI